MKITPINEIVGGNISKQISAFSMQKECRIGAFLIFFAVEAGSLSLPQNSYAFDFSNTFEAATYEQLNDVIGNRMRNPLLVEDMLIDVENNVHHREAQNYREMKLSFDSNQFEDKDGMFSAAFEALASGLKSIKMQKVYVDIDYDGGLITFCMNVGNKIQIDVAKSVDDDDMENEVMFSFLYKGDIVVMNTIDLENVTPMVEEIQAEVVRM